MKRLIGSVLLTAGMVMTVQSAEYVVQPGDDWRKISKITGHTIDQLMQMNYIDHVDSILVRQKITYISEKDIEEALLYCQKQVQELLPSDPQYIYFEQAIEFIKTKNIRYSHKPPDRDTTGIHYWMLLSLAYTWQQRHADSQE